MNKPFAWPKEMRCAVSLTFDDARLTQIEAGIPILDRFGLRGTFYVLVPEVLKFHEAWRTAVSHGHEVGNHTINHPCSANFVWCKNHLEKYTLQQMCDEFDHADEAIHRALGIWPKTFAYPCGNKFVGRGDQTRSYVPLVNGHFLAGRGFRDETPNNPQLCDLAQLAGVDADRHSFEVLKHWIDRTLEVGGWLCFVNHDVSPTLAQGIKPDTLAQVCDYLKQHTGVWVDTIANIAQYVASQQVMKNEADFRQKELQP